MSPRKPTRSGQRTKADKTFSKKIRDRDKRCLNCSSREFLQCAHIFSRRYYSVRWDPENAVALCRGCHVHFTHHPLEWEDWCKEYMGHLGPYPEGEPCPCGGCGAYYALRMKAMSVWDKSYERVFEELEPN